MKEEGRNLKSFATGAKMGLRNEKKRFLTKPTTVVFVKTLEETAMVRSTYAWWCGGTEAKASSYPIRNK